MHIMSGEATEAQIGGLLVGLAAKGTTVEELVGAATRHAREGVPVGVRRRRRRARHLRHRRRRPRDVQHLHRRRDHRGGGGREGRQAREPLGVEQVRLGRRAGEARREAGADAGSSSSAACDEANICFAFARCHHPAMKFVAPARTSLGIPTIFNLLGPLTNPARAKHQLLGVFAPELTDRLATVLRELGSERAWVVHADDGLDELSTLGPTRVSELQRRRGPHLARSTRATLGLPYARLSRPAGRQRRRVGRRDLAGCSIGEPGPPHDITVAQRRRRPGRRRRGRRTSPTALQRAEDAIDTGRGQPDAGDARPVFAGAEMPTHIVRNRTVRAAMKCRSADFANLPCNNRSRACNDPRATWRAAPLTGSRTARAQSAAGHHRRTPASIRRPPPKRIDLHCHSDASNKAAEAALNAISCPECYSEPRRGLRAGQAPRDGLRHHHRPRHDRRRRAHRRPRPTCSSAKS